MIPRPPARPLLLLCTLLLAGCASTGGSRSQPQPVPDTAPIVTAPLPELPAPPDSGPAAANADIVVMRALGLVGVRYRYGGTRPDTGLDCSGLVRWAFREVPGIELPRASGAMYAMGLPAVPRDALAPDDLVFFPIVRAPSMSASTSARAAACTRPDNGAWFGFLVHGMTEARDAPAPLGPHS